MPINTTIPQGTAVLVALTTPQQPSAKTEAYLKELAFLALTLGIRVLKTFVQKLKTPDVKTIVGKGKLAEIKDFVKNYHTAVIFDNELSPSQMRNLTHQMQCKVWDRKLLILEIFAMRAKTAQAKIQVELAQYQHLLPSLTGMWTHLSKQKGGSTGMRGPGEKELETDRKIVQTKIAHLRKKLSAIEQQGQLQRKQRQRLVRVALVGYTNVGKSTLMRTLSKANVHTENKLFATTDATVRKVFMRNIPFLLTDTVGFIRKLPHTLIECFKSTLAEVREADILLHVVDIAHPAWKEHIQVVNKTLQEIGVDSTPTILVGNKADQLNQTKVSHKDTANPPALHCQVQLGKEEYPSVTISAIQKNGIKKLKQLLFEQLHKRHISIYPNYPNSDTNQTDAMIHWPRSSTDRIEVS